jgi:hypothetical protein
MSGAGSSVFVGNNFEGVKKVRYLSHEISSDLMRDLNAF